MYGRGQAPDPPRSSPRKPCDGMPAQFCLGAAWVHFENVAGNDHVFLRSA